LQAESFKTIKQLNILIEEINMTKMTKVEMAKQIELLQAQVDASETKVRNFGRLVRASNTSNPRAPSMFGEISIEGVAYKLAAFNKTSKAGNVFLNIEATAV
jgi:hypothetical protein